MDAERARTTTTQGTRRWSSALGAVLVVAGLPVAGLAQDPSPPPGGPTPVRPVAAETPSTVLVRTEDMPRSAQSEIDQALAHAERGASGAHRRYAAAAPVRTRAERTARRNARAQMIRLAQQLFQRGGRGNAYPPERGARGAYRPRRATRGWNDGYDRGGWRRGGGEYGRRGWMGRGGRGRGF